MEGKVTFDYFYGSGADAFSFYRIPKLLFTYDYFKGLSTDAKVLYGLMLDRMGLSVKNRWFDSDNRAYIYFSIEDAMELLNCGKNKAIKSMQELDSEQGIGLIEKRRQGMGKANIIYVKSFSVDEGVKFNNQTSGEVENTEVYNSNRSLEQTSRGLQVKLPEVYIEDPNNTRINKTEMSNTESNLILSADGMGLDEMSAYADIIRDNLELDIMLERYPYEQELLQGIYELILETVLTKGKTIIIASNEYPTELVKSKFLKLNCMHLEYVMPTEEGDHEKNWTKKLDTDDQTILMTAKEAQKMEKMALSKFEELQVTDTTTVGMSTVNGVTECASVDEDESEDKVWTITAFGADGISSKRCQNGIILDSWEIKYNNPEDANRVNEFISQFNEDADLKFAGSKDFWTDFLSNDMNADKIFSTHMDAFDKASSNAPSEVKEAWMNAAKATGYLEGGKMNHISQLLIRQVINRENGVEDYQNVFGSSVASALQAAKELLFDLENPLTPISERGENAQEYIKQEKEFYRKFIANLEEISSNYL